MHVLENVQRRLGVAFARRLVQHLRHLSFAFSAALLFGILRDGVELHKPAVFDRRHARRIGQRVALQAFLGGEIDALQHCLGRFDLARFIR